MTISKPSEIYDTIPVSASETIPESVGSGEHPIIDTDLAEFDIPTIDAHRFDGDVESLEWTRWGRKNRAEEMDAVHFYANDYKFLTVLRDPALVINTGARLVIEPDTSSAEDDPFPVSLSAIWRRRNFAACLQDADVAVAVNLNCVGWLRDLVLTGVPTDYPYFATRYQAADLNGEPVGLEGLDEDYALAKEHCGDNPFDFWVYSGGKVVRQYCEKNGWHHITSANPLPKRLEG